MSYNSAVRLRADIDAYVSGISLPVAATGEYLSDETDEKGRKIKLEKELVNERGEVVFVREWIVPPSVSGLCLSLGISRGEWESYRRKPKLKGEVERFETILRAYLENELSTRQKNASGIIWQLQQLGGEREEPEQKRLSLKRRLEILEELGVKLT